MCTFFFLEKLPNLKFEADFPNFVNYTKKLRHELEKGQFETILKMDLAQDFEVFVHMLPSVAVFRDGGIKRAWVSIIGIVSKSLQTERLDIHSLSPLLNFALSVFHWTQFTTEVELEITPVWPYAVGLQIFFFFFSNIYYYT
ncbi:hypothetical protein RFI_15055 [Reticulomyxa filosa]|uniref:Uncharacterized protein n=1 Tax=Reticulomyxa filosa TaxID=46433 RepID=X6N7V9_RETFI|nr:hypothetical protein RFI_15055 [Reticulomyxa filosa]|eukprot:ETO22146.1 hypothetical protein RFI_15055 [Reticulomyxa filosa]